MNKSLIPIEGMTPEEIDYYVTKLMAAKQNQLEAQLKQVMESQKKAEEANRIMYDEVSNSLGRIGEEVDRAKDMAASSQTAKAVRYGWVNQGDFGRFFEKSIGAKTMGKLLKAVGLAMKSKGSTTPYRHNIPKYAMTTVNRNSAGYDFTAVQWNYENCMEYINEWLQEHGYYEAFYSVRSTKEMGIFINNLYEKA